MNAVARSLIEELEDLNKRAFQMALTVHKDPALRAENAQRARVLRERLLKIAEDLERIAPRAHKQWFHRISESLLDLDFVVADSGTTSLRLGDIVKWG